MVIWEKFFNDKLTKYVEGSPSPIKHCFMGHIDIYNLYRFDFIFETIYNFNSLLHRHR